jgi:hypothetical protein
MESSITKTAHSSKSSQLEALLVLLVDNSIMTQMVFAEFIDLVVFVYNIISDCK